VYCSHGSSFPNSLHIVLPLTLLAKGITAVWLPPPTKGASFESTGYDIYDLWDLGEFKREGHEGERTKYGTKQELMDCYKALKDNGVS